MEDCLLAVADNAIAAGWTPEEVAAALVELADNHMRSVLADRDLSRQLAAIKK